MDLESTEYAISTGIPKEKRQHSGWRSDMSERRNSKVGIATDIFANDKYRKSKRARLSFINGNHWDGKGRTRNMAISRKIDSRKARGTMKNSLSMLQWWKSWTSRIQGNLVASSGNGLLERYAKRNPGMNKTMSNMSERRGNTKNRSEEDNETIQEDIDTSVYWSYYQIIKVKRIWFNFGNKRPIFGNDISKTDERKWKHSISMTELQEDYMKIARISEENTNRQKNYIHVKNIKRKNKEKENRISKNNRISSISQQSDETDK